MSVILQNPTLRSESNEARQHYHCPPWLFAADVAIPFDGQPVEPSNSGIMVHSHARGSRRSGYRSNIYRNTPGPVYCVTVEVRDVDALSKYGLRGLNYLH